MNAKRSFILRRIACAALALLMVLTCLPWIAPTWASAQDVDGTVVHSESFEQTDTGYVGSRIGGWNIGVQTSEKITVNGTETTNYYLAPLGAGSSVEIVDSGDAARGHVMKITQTAGRSSITLDYPLPNTSGYTSLDLSFEFCASSGLQVNSMGFRGGLPNARSYITLKGDAITAYDKATTASTTLISAAQSNYTPGQWYCVRIKAYRNASNVPCYDIYIDGECVASGFGAHDGQYMKALQFVISGAGSTGTLMIDNVVASEVLSSPTVYYGTETFEEEKTDDSGAAIALNGWTVSGATNSTVEIGYIGDDTTNQVLKVNYQDKSPHVFVGYAFTANSSTKYGDMQLSFDIMTDAGVKVNRLGFCDDALSQERMMITLDGNGAVKTLTTNGTLRDTTLASYEAGKWYSVKIVSKMSLGRLMYYDIYFGEKGGDLALIASNVKAANNTMCRYIVMDVCSSTLGCVYLDNVSVTQTSTLCMDSFEDMPTGTADSQAGWYITTATKAATATVTDLTNSTAVTNGADYGKALALYQSGKDSGNMQLVYPLDASYQDIDLYFDVFTTNKNNITGSGRGILTAALGTYSANTDHTLNGVDCGSLLMRDQAFYITENSGRTKVGDCTQNTWYSVKISYRYDEATAKYTYSVDVDGVTIADGKAAKKDSAINALVFTMEPGYPGTVYIDNLVAADPTNEPSTTVGGAVYAGKDSATGSAWFTTDAETGAISYVYGADQAILLGKNNTAAFASENAVKYNNSDFGTFSTNAYATVNGNAYHRMLIHNNDRDSTTYYSNTEDGAIQAKVLLSDQLWLARVSESTKDLTLDLATPADVAEPSFASTYNVYTFRGVGVDDVSRTSYRFTNLDAEESYLFTVFGRNPYGLDGSVRFTFLDEEGNTTYVKTFSYSDFGTTGAYVSFIVNGSFTLYMDKLETNASVGYFGVSAFFFDPLTENNTMSLKATAGTAVRSVDLSWTEKDGNTDSILILRKESGGTYSPIATVNAGVKTYTDTGLTAGQTYTYMLCCNAGTDYSVFSKEASYTVPPYTGTTLTLTPDANEDSYTYTWATQTGNTVAAQLTAADGSTIPAGLNVTLTVTWAFDGETSQTFYGTTAEGGAVIFSDVDAQYMGEAQLHLLFADDDMNQLAQSETTGTLFVGEREWTEAPVVWRVSDAIEPGSTIGVYGYGMSEENMEVKISKHSSANAAAEPGADAISLDILQYDYENGSYLMVELPDSAEPGLYDIWVKNAYGYSEPMVLNAARPLFISEYEAWAGQTIQVSGRNLDASQFGAARNTQLRLVPVNGGEPVVQTLTKLTPYSLVFTVSGAAGEYDVEITNDGLTWVRPQTGQTLTIVEEGDDPLGFGLAWMDSFNWSNQVNVTDFGATANDDTDDTAAFAAALAAVAENGGVVYMPDGNYRISTLDIPAYVVLMGESMEGTVITYCGDGAKTNMFEGTQEAKAIGYQGFARFTINLADETKRPDCFFWLGHDWVNNYAYDQRIRTADSFFLYQINLDSADTKSTSASRGLGIVVLGNERMAIHDCVFSGFLVGMGNTKISRYMSVKNNAWYLESGNIYIGANYSFIENNYVKGRFTELEDDEHVGNTHGLCFSAYAHLEENFVEKMGSKTDITAPSGEFNDGETYLPECQENFETGYVVNATENSVTIRTADGEFNEIAVTSRAWSRNRLCVVIMAGRGAGQLKTIGSIDYETGLITLAEGESWDVIPDSTSIFSINLPLECYTLYNNSEATSSKGVYLYGDSVDAVVANHTCTDTLGISVFSSSISANRMKMAYYITIRDNLVTGHSARARTGHISVNAGREYVGTYYATNAFGIEIRNNTILGERGLTGWQNTEAIAYSGIVLRAGASHMPTDSTDGDITGVIMEGNTLSNLDAGISYSVQAYGLLAKDNTFCGCGAKFAQMREFQDDDALILHLTEINSTVVGDPVIASVNGTDLYTDLSEAIDAASSGQTVQLLADVENDGVLVKNGISLDLNGYKLTSDYVIGFTGSQVLDSIGDGLLISENVRLASDNDTMPVWVKVSDEEAGYRFFTVVDYQKYRWQEDNSFQFISKPAAGAAANDGLIAEAAINGHLTVKMRLSWTNTSGNEVEQNFTMKKEDVYDVYTVDEYLIQLTVTGTANYKNLISTTTVIESDTGVVWAATAQLYTGAQN